MNKLHICTRVWVKLTPEGKERFRRHKKVSKAEAEVLLSFTKDPSGNGRSRFLLWELMEIFGPMMQMGAKAPFEGGDIYAEETD